MNVSHSLTSASASISTPSSIPTLIPSPAVPGRTSRADAPLLLVFSHLRWGFVYQRPQHLLSRLAGRWRVLFVEEPVHAPGPAWLERSTPVAGLEVLVPHTPAAAGGFHDDQLAHLQPLLARHLAAEGLQPDVAWLYTPMALPLARLLGPAALVYDCMDELSAFAGAPRQLRRRESALLRQAALVLTGGPSLYEARRGRHPHVHCIPSAVDAAHYNPARLRGESEEAAAAQALQGHLPAPRLGFFGVIDERLDVALVAGLADAHPEWSIVMVGPVVKIAPASLPMRPNLHWLGLQPYERLPYLLQGWDVALLPFALNESTRFISPTKTLEYMAGDKPVVGTPIRDVVALYGDAVTVAGAVKPFVEACEAVLVETAQQRCRRVMEMLTTVSMHSWDRSADVVHGLVCEALAQSRAASTAGAAAVPAVATQGALAAGL